MFLKSSSEGYQEKLPGVFQKTLAFGEKTLITSIKILKGSSIPPHQHIHEQTGYLISGRLEYSINDEYFLAEAGDSWTILGSIRHGAIALEDTHVIEAFAPIREDYLP